MVLESGFQYRFRTQYTPGVEDLSVVNDYVLVYCDEGWLNAFFHVIENFGTGCINLLLYFDWYGDYENPFLNEDSPISLISDSLNNITTYVSDSGNSFESVIDSITGSLELFSMFTERFDWLLGLCIFTLAIIVITRFIGL